MLNSVSDFPIYWKQQILHCINYMNSSFFQLLYISLYIFIVYILLFMYISLCFLCQLVLKYCRRRISSQHKFPDFEKQWKIQNFSSRSVSVGFRRQNSFTLVDRRGFCSFLKVRKIALETHLEILGLYEANSNY